MFFTKRILVLCLVLSSLNGFSQNKFFLEAHVSPLLIPLGDIGFEEHGLGFFDFNYEEKFSPEFGLSIGMISKNNKWRFGLGTSLKYYETKFDYTWHHPVDKSRIIQFREDNISYQFIGINAFSSFQLTEKFRVRFSVELNDPVRIRFNYRTNFGWIPLFPVLDFEGDDTFFYHYEKNEWYTPSSSPYHYIIPELSFQYNIFNSINLFGGVNWKPFRGEYFNYRLLIDGTVYEHRENTIPLNDTRFYNKFLFLNFGVNYQFDFGKRSK